MPTVSEVKENWIERNTIKQVGLSLDAPLAALGDILSFALGFSYQISQTTMLLQRYY
jgi:hypothetical protein